MQPLFSIIVPIYNAEKYLPECLASILSQTLSDYEVIMVDDGSTDASSSIAKSFALQDKRFKYFRQCNCGTSGATNACLDRATGKYVINLDNDDYISSDLLEDAAKHITNRNPDIIQYQSTFISESGSVNHSQSFYGEVLFFNGNASLDQCERTMPGAFNRTHSRKVIRRELIGQIRFRGPAKGADTSFLKRVLFHAENIIFSPLHMFYVRELPTSESRKPSSPLLYKAWLMREIEDIEECAMLNTNVHRPLPLWEFSDFLDYYQIFAAKAVRAKVYDGKFFRKLNRRIIKMRQYLFTRSIRSGLKWRLWLYFTHLMAADLSKRIPSGDFVV